MKGALDLSWGQMAFAYVFPLITYAICYLRQIQRGRDLITSAFRMTVQLVIAGSILTVILGKPQPRITLMVFLVMEIFSVFTIFRRVKTPLPPALKRAAAIAQMFGTVVCVSYFLFFVVRPHPWFDPQYFIPLGGMMIGNAMTAVALAMTRLIDAVREGRDQIEGALILGADPKRAMKASIDKTFDAAILPTLSSMAGMGIVILPGMMTGQILSGSAPNTAIKYQIAIMLGILGTTSICVLTFLTLASQSLFNEKKQLVFEDQLLALKERKKFRRYKFKRKS